MFICFDQAGEASHFFTSRYSNGFFLEKIQITLVHPYPYNQAFCVDFFVLIDTHHLISNVFRLRLVYLTETFLPRETEMIWSQSENRQGRLDPSRHYALFYAH